MALFSRFFLLSIVVVFVFAKLAPYMSVVERWFADLKVWFVSSDTSGAPKKRAKNKKKKQNENEYIVQASTTSRELCELPFFNDFRVMVLASMAAATYVLGALLLRCYSAEVDGGGLFALFALVFVCAIRLASQLLGDGFSPRLRTAVLIGSASFGLVYFAAAERAEALLDFSLSDGVDEMAVSARRALNALRHGAGSRGFLSESMADALVARVASAQLVRVAVAAAGGALVSLLYLPMMRASKCYAAMAEPLNDSLLGQPMGRALGALRVLVAALSIAAWIEPLYADVLPAAWLDDAETLDALRVGLLGADVLLQLALVRANVQAFLHSAYSMARELISRRQAGIDESTQAIRKTIAIIYHSIYVPAVQLVAPALMLGAMAMMLANYSGLSMFTKALRSVLPSALDASEPIEYAVPPRFVRSLAAFFALLHQSASLLFFVVTLFYHRFVTRTS
jgi:Predicted transmembrane protein 161AB